MTDSVAGTARQQLDAMIDETALGYGMGIGERDDYDTPDRGSLVWLAEEAYKLGAAGLRTQLEQAQRELRTARQKLAMAGVEGSPPPGMEATIPLWKRRAVEWMKRAETANLALSSLQGALRKDVKTLKLVEEMFGKMADVLHGSKEVAAKLREGRDAICEMRVNGLAALIASEKPARPAEIPAGGTPCNPKGFK